VDKKAERVELPKSEVLDRRVWTKVTKGQTAVRKLLVWKTNKEGADPRFSPYVVQWTDYSAGRKEPLQREVRRAPNVDVARAIAESMIAENVKKGWNEV
nr:hypothetical protein [Myxococcota bacterium]